MEVVMSRLVRAIAAGALLAAPLAAQERVLGLGRAVQDELRDTDPAGRSRGAPYHVWFLEGRRGQRVTLELSSSRFDTYLMVRDEAGWLVGSDDDSGEGTDSRVRVILPRDGRYRVIATAFSESGRGAYTLTATSWEVPGAAAPGATGTVRVGEVRDGILEPGDAVSDDGHLEDRWLLEARPGQRLLVQLRSEDFDSYLEVRGARGELVASDDDALEGLHAEVSVRVAEGGRYTVIATSVGQNPATGAYRLSVLEDRGEYANPGVRVRLEPGRAAEGRLESGDRRGRRGFEDEWTFRGRAGQLARIDVMSEQFDTYALLRLAGMPLDSNDDGGEGTNSRLVHVLPSDGEYTLIVTPYSSSRGTGRYRVTLEFSEAPPAAGRGGRLEPGRRVGGRLESGDERREEGGYRDVWTFEGRAGQDVLIEMRSAEFDTYLELLDPQGGLVTENDDGGEGTDSFISVRLSASGRYRVVARSYGEGDRTGFYDLLLTLGAGVGVPGQVRELAPDVIQLGRLEEGDSVIGDGTWADVYELRAPRTGEVTIEMRSSDFDAYLFATDEEGVTLGTDDDSGGGTDALLVLAVEAGRTYRIYANSYGAYPVAGIYRLVARYRS
jgi:hypothetical protein